ncbi:hypothetical protein CDL15_Pgr028990 [Punica granatum]|uniref:Uncharacterized protein n=2 Tax=Punica granatum TaxID=22663 RepID=A0A218XKR8_PUNGR|nr:hypothetical protein CDL15_Pgr028990 [Punica granatum]
MASLSTTLSLPSSCPSSCSRSSNKSINAAIHFSRPPRVRFSTPELTLTTQRTVDEPKTAPALLDSCTNSIDNDKSAEITTQLYMILEEVNDRVEMHRNVGEQRDNWNTLLLNSINMMTLAATTMAGLSAVSGGSSGGPLKLSSFLLFSASTGMLMIMNKIQPSQLAEEQRNAMRLFKKLDSEIKSKLALGGAMEADVEELVLKVLALDRAFPLPLLGKMLEKFPKKFEPATWWPSKSCRPVKEKKSERVPHQQSMESGNNNGWSEELETEMRAVVEVMKRKDVEDYVRLGNLVLKTSKVLAASGPSLTALAAVGSALMGPHSGGSWATMAALLGGALAAAVNTFEHGGQVGMVVEMYRNCTGFFGLLGESIETEIEERRENGELFEMKVALQLGRSLPELRDLAKKSIYSNTEGIELNEFASKLF